MNLVARYFLFVGGALLAVLFAFDAFAPKASANNTAQPTAGVDKSTLRIQSNQKWPEKIVFDTTQPTVTPKAAPVQQAAALPGPEPAPEMSAKARVRETFAQFVPVEPKADTPAPRKRKVAKVRHNQPMRFAQQPYGFFGPSTW
ncbi:hypothetical protein JQ628_26585 [Bradyrhizobium lablabi]|uniref:hypothetical protein n=1 Tax=Bradyrhizobium lablabi TaxID=722472 RepID=UPI001BA98B39|nr:hypothetical protein [Bradyrhizobium lablabi]MBR1125115.1 hypothetical protein [Bradyrhizobium lablabi]